jgi:hypothetical protein
MIIAGDRQHMIAINNPDYLKYRRQWRQGEDRQADDQHSTRPVAPSAKLRFR